MNKKFYILALLLVIVAAGLGLWWAGAFRSEPTDESSRQNSNSEPASAVDQFPGLPDGKQQLIWDLEHVTFEFENGIGKPFCAALRERNIEQLNGMFAAGFSGRILTAGDPALKVVRNQITETAWKPAHSDSADSEIGTSEVASAPSSSTDDFAAHLLERLSSFESFAGASLRVLQIKAESNDVKSRRWRMQTLLQVTGTGADGTLLAFKQDGQLVSEFAHDAVLSPSPVIQSWTVEEEKLTASPPLMKEVTATAGLQTLPLPDNWTVPEGGTHQYTIRVASADFDQDQDQDVAIVSNSGDCFLLENQQGHFTRQTRAFGLPNRIDTDFPVWLVVWIDVDNDGFQDLLLGSDIYHNRNGKRFERYTLGTGLQFEHFPMGAIVADYDADGLLDIYLLNQHPRTQVVPPSGKIGWVGDDVTGAPNRLYRNLGGFRFEDVTEAAGVAGGSRHSFAGTWLHANQDHYPDLYVANDFAQNSFFINRGNGTFQDISQSSATADFATSMGVTSGDIDGDGRPEIYVANMFSKMGRRILGQIGESDYPPGVYQQLLGSCAGNRLYRSRADSNTYDEVSVELGINKVGWAYAPALVDFDADGFLDIYATAGFLSFSRSEPDG